MSEVWKVFFSNDEKELNQLRSSLKESLLGSSVASRVFELVRWSWSFGEVPEWKKHLEELDAVYRNSDAFASATLTKNVHGTNVVLRQEDRREGRHPYMVTMVRAGIENRRDIQFRIFPSGYFSEIKRRAGMQDIAISNEEFNADFILQSNSPETIKRLIDDEELLKEIRKIKFRRIELTLWNVIEIEIDGTVYGYKHLNNLFGLVARLISRFSSRKMYD